MVQDQATFPQAMAVVLEPRCNRMTTGVVVEILGCACLHERSLYPIVGMDVRKHTFVLAHLQHTLQDALCVGWEWGLVGALLRGLSRLSVLKGVVHKVGSSVLSRSLRRILTSAVLRGASRTSSLT